MSKKEKTLVCLSIAGIGIAGYFGLKQVKILKGEIELLKQDIAGVSNQLSIKIDNLKGDI